MVIIHIANIDAAVIGGVQFAVPGMVRAQSQYADVGLINTHGEIIDDVQMIGYDGQFDICKFPIPFNKPDIVVFHEVYRGEYIKIYRSLVKDNIPYVIVPHGCLSKKAQQKKKLKKVVANFLLFDNFIKHARSVQYLSDSEAKNTAFARYASFVAGNGVPISAEKKSSFSGDCIKFVYIGRLEMHIKGLDLLLESVKKCEKSMRENGAKVEIYGPDYGDSHNRIMQMISQLDIADLVSLGKEKTGKEKKKILLASDCFIQTSRTEGLPLGPLEALGYGLPCIVTDGVGLGNVIELFGAGYRCSTSADGIATAIEQFINNIDNAGIMSKSAVRLVEEVFDINLLAQKNIAMYYELLNQS